MEKLSFTDWLKKEDKLEIESKSGDISKRIDFLTQEVYYNQQNNIEAYNAMEIIIHRQKELAKGLGSLTDLLTQYIKK
jgi:hypothetical protein